MISAAELDALDVGVRLRDRMVAARLLIPIVRGVYRLSSTPPSLEGRCLAVCLARDDAFVTGLVAGRLWNVRRMGAIDVNSPIDIRLPHYAQAFTAQGFVQRRCSALDPTDIVTRDDGIRMASPPRLVFDLAARLDDLDLESVIEQVLDRRWCTMPTLCDTGRRLAHPNRPGSARFARVVASRPAWLKPADSHLEVRLFDGLRARGVTGMVRQHPITLPGGWTIHADVAVPSLRWAIPVDHVEWHGGRVDAQRDKQNDRQARSIGWQVDRVTDGDLDHAFQATLDELCLAWRRLQSLAA